jgi:hypothetical protein
MRDIAFGLFFIACGAFGVFWPRTASLFGSRWRYADPDNVEPSNAGLAATVGGGLIAIAIGALMIIFWIRAEISSDPGDTKSVTTPDKAMAEARQLDQKIRQLASSTGPGTRDPKLAKAAIKQVIHTAALADCSQWTPSEPVEKACVDQEERTHSLVPDSNYRTSGWITINRGDGADLQTVCLTVSEDPSVLGTISTGACPGPRAN